MVGRITQNPILKGIRQRNRKEAKRLNRTGKHTSVDAHPEDLLERDCPHLAFFDAAYYDRVVAKVKTRNAKYLRNGKSGTEPRSNIPKKRTRYPGQSIRCGVCGRLLVFGAHGIFDRLMCTGAREYLCWNALSISGPATAQHVAESILAEVQTLDDFDTAFLELVNEEARKLDSQREHRVRDLNSLIVQHDREVHNLLKFIRSGGDGPSVRDDLRQLEAKLPQLRAELAEIEGTPSQVLDIPSAAEIRQLAQDSVRNQAWESQEFAKRMRVLVTDFFVFPQQSCDGKDLVLRGTARLQLANLLPDHRVKDALRAPLERVLHFDLFEPPQRIKYRKQVMALRAEMTEQQAADRLGISKTMAQHAARLDRLMQRLNLVDPYMQLMEPPMDYPKLRRHLHSRYRFEPLPGFGSI